MVYTLVVLALTQPAGLFLLFRYLNQRDERETRDRQILMNRIQSPETAVVQTLSPVDEADLTPDTEATELSEYERLMGTFTDA